MGQAKRRGTYEERKQQAIETHNPTWERLHPKEAKIIKEEVIQNDKHRDESGRRDSDD